MKLKSRKLWWTLAVIVAIALASVVSSYGWLAIRASKTRIDRPTAQLIKLGMSKEEAQGIIGGPPGDYSIGIWPATARDKVSEEPYFNPPWSFMNPARREYAAWLGDHGLIILHFGNAGTVEDVSFKPVSQLKWGPWYPSLYQKAKRLVCKPGPAAPPWSGQ